MFCIKYEIVHMVIFHINKKITWNNILLLINTINEVTKREYFKVFLFYKYIATTKMEFNILIKWKVSRSKGLPQNILGMDGGGGDHVTFSI